MKKLLFLLLFLPFLATAQRSPVMKHLVVTVNNATDSALLSMPNSVASGTLYPLLIFCHGNGEAADGSTAGTGLQKIINSTGSGGPIPFIAQGTFPDSVKNPKDGKWYKYIVLAPQENSWGLTGADLSVLIPYMISHYPVDPTRVYLTGLSAGGQGVIDYIGAYNATQTTLPAAAVPMSPAIDINSPELPNSIATIAKNKTPCWFFGDSVRDIYGIAAELLWVGINKAAPADAIYTQFNTGHGPWNPFYNPTYSAGGMSIYQWMLQYTNGTTNLTPPPTGGSGGSTGGSSGGSSSSGAHHRYVMTPQADSGWINTTPTYQPGDTLDFPAKYQWLYIELDNYVGQPGPGNALIITNSGGQTVATDGMTFVSSTYVHVTGTGAPGVKYGFQFTNPTPNLRSQSPFAMEVYNRSKCLEFDHLYMHNVGIGFHIETDNNCDQTLDYPNWVIDTVLIHDNYICGTWNEGMYIGNTSPDNASYDQRPDQCSVAQSTPTYSIPMKNGYTHIWNNVVDSTGRGGIQVANASYAEVDSNQTSHDGMNGDDAQGTGISLGLYTNGYVHDNHTNNTLTWGIASIGAGTTGHPVVIKRNVMDSCGFLVNWPAIATTSLETFDPATQPTAPDPYTYPYAIWLDSRPRVYTTATPPGTCVPGSDSITFIIDSNVIGLYKCETSSTDNQSAIQIEDHDLALASTGDTICGNTRSIAGKTVTIYTGNAGHPVNYYSCGTSTSGGSGGGSTGGSGCPTCPTCPAIPAAAGRITSVQLIQVNGVTHLQATFWDGTTAIIF